MLVNRPLTLFRSEHIAHRYDGPDQTERRPVLRTSQANLVSSAHTVPGPVFPAGADMPHTPALDVDQRVVALAGTTLWLDGLTQSTWAAACSALAAHGLAAPPPPDPVGNASRTWFDDVALVAAHREQYANLGEVEDLPRLGQAVAVFGSHADTTFADTISLTNAVLGPVPMTGPPAMGSPWPIRFTVPVMVLPSTSNHHVYLDTVMVWDDYAKLLAALSGNLLEDGFVRASLARDGTHLRLPWVRKTQLSPAPF